LAPILISFSRTLISDQGGAVSYIKSLRMMLPRLFEPPRQSIGGERFGPVNIA
jgi:hypothetical protein